MLRHFAVLTVVATVCLAMFASGENASALRDAQEAKRARSSGAWGTTPAAPPAAKGERTVNGLKVAGGTRLNQNGSYEQEPEIYRQEQEIQGDVRNLNPEFRNLPPSPLLQGAQGGMGTAPLAAVPPQIKRDPSGIPIPPGATGQGRQPANVRPARPRPPSADEIDRMMEESLQRSATGNGSTGTAADAAI